jgi:hypothetical protein
MSNQEPTNDEPSRGHGTHDTISKIINIVLGQGVNLQRTKDHRVTMEKKSLSLHASKISLWIKEKSEMIWEAVLPVMAAEFQMNKTEFKLPEDYKDGMYLREGKQMIDNILLSPKPQDLTVAVHSLVLWSTISTFSKNMTMNVLCTLLERVPKFDDMHLGWKYIWHIYMCTSCLGRLSFSRVVHKEGDDTKGIEMYFLSRMLDLVGSLFIYLMRSGGMTHKPIHQPVIFKSGVISNDLLHFITAALLCSVHLEWNELIQADAKEDSNKNILQAISEEVEWDGNFDVTSYAMMYFYQFNFKFNHNPKLMEEKIKKAMAKAKSSNEGLNSLNDIVRRDDLFDRTVGLNRHKTATAHIEESGLEEDDVAMIDKPYENNPFVDNEAKEDTSEDACFDNSEELDSEENIIFTSPKKKGDDEMEDQSTPTTNNTGTKTKKSGNNAEELGIKKRSVVMMGLQTSSKGTNAFHKQILGYMQSAPSTSKQKSAVPKRSAASAFQHNGTLRSPAKQSTTKKKATGAQNSPATNTRSSSKKQRK